LLKSVNPCFLLIAGHDSEEEDIAAQLGVGSLAADVELDALKDAAEGEIVGMKSLLGRYAPLLAALCHNRYSFLLASLCTMLFDPFMLSSPAVHAV
jgi:hypothetical protein